jgi:hypothetical protein
MLETWWAVQVLVLESERMQIPQMSSVTLLLLLHLLEWFGTVPWVRFSSVPCQSRKSRRREKSKSEKDERLREKARERQSREKNVQISPQSHVKTINFISI